jgi:hypothetical protein
MKTNLLCKISSIICALMFASFSSAQAATINSTYTGPIGGNWNDPANWSPNTVPNNNGTDTFNVSVDSEYPGVTLDVDVNLNSLTLSTTTDFSAILATDHSLTSAATSLAVNFADEQFGGGAVVFEARHSNVIANLGNLADFSGTTLNGGNYIVISDHADSGMTATIQFNGADIRTSNGDMLLAGPSARIVDENGNDALRNFEHNLLYGIFDFETGRNFMSAGSIVNEGDVHVISEFAGADANTTLTINGDYTGIGFPLDEGTLGRALVEAAGPIGDAKMVINGALTNYNAARKTLNKTWYQWEAANGRSATTQVLGGSRPLDIVTNNASLNLYGPNTGLRDKFGNDALRNLAVSARFFMGDRDFTTADSFTSTSRLSIYGNSHFNVNGHLLVSGDQFQVFALTGYALLGEDGFPNDPPYKKSYITVRGSLDMRSVDRFRYGIFDNATLPSVTINGAAKLGGALVPYLLDGANVSASDRFTLMTAANMVGHFSNVVSGGRVTAFSYPDGSELGTFLLTINKRSIVLSDFQPAQMIPDSRATHSGGSRTLNRGLDGNDGDF